MKFINIIKTKFLILLILVLSSFAQAELSPRDFKISVYNGNEDFRNIEDVSKNINIDKFVPLNSHEKTLNSKTWIKIEWDKKKVTDESFILNNDFAVNQRQTYLLVKNNNILQQYDSSETLSKDQKEIQHFKFFFDVGGADYVLAQICCKTQPSRFFYLRSRAEIINDNNLQSIRYAVVYSLIILMILYNFFIWIYLKDKKYFWYCSYLGFGVLGLLSLSGVGRSLLWADTQNSYLIFYNQSALYTISSILFVVSFLDKKYFSKITHRIINTTLLFCCFTSIFSLLSFTLGSDNFINIINNHLYVVEIVAWLGIIVNNYVIIRSLLTGDCKAKIILFSYSVINVGMIIMSLRNSFLLPDNFWTTYALEIAFVLEAVILSLVLAQDLQNLRQKNLLMEQQQKQQQQQFSWQLIEVQEEEKRQIGSTLHENYTHQLLILKNSLLKKIGAGSEVSAVEKILNEIKTLSYLIHPYTIEKLGLEAALSEMTQNLVQNDDFEINLSLCCCDFSEEQELIVFRIIQEALNNIIKHANANECVIALECKQDLVTIIIKDDGDGFDVTSNDGFGIKMLKERCKKLSGNIYIQSDSLGTTITITFPVDNTTLKNQLIANNNVL